MQNKTQVVYDNVVYLLPILCVLFLCIYLFFGSGYPISIYIQNSDYCLIIFRYYSIIL